MVVGFLAYFKLGLENLFSSFFVTFWALDPRNTILHVLNVKNIDVVNTVYHKKHQIPKHYSDQ